MSKKKIENDLGLEVYTEEGEIPGTQKITIKNLKPSKLISAAWVGSYEDKENEEENNKERDE